MSARQQSKRARFALRQARRRESDRAWREHGHRPGFIGVVRNLTITAPGGRGSMFPVGLLFLAP